MGDYIAVLITRRDLSFRIEHSESTIKTLMDDTPGGFCRMKIFENSHPVIEYMNKGFCRMLDMTEDEAIREYGADAYKCLNEDDIAGMISDSEKAINECGQFTTRCGLRRKGGDFIRVTVFGRFVRDEYNDIYLNSYFTDITEREKEEEKQKKLLDNLPCGAALYMFDGKNLSVIHINKKYWELVKREPVDYSKESVFNVVFESDRKVAYDEIFSAISQKRDAVCDLRIKCGDDNYRVFHVTANIVKQTDGRYAFFTTYIRVRD